jgi:hypothetical protein
MNIYKNVQTVAGLEDFEFNLKTLNATSFELNLKSQHVDNTHIIDKNLILKDAKSKSLIVDPHSVICLFVEDNNNVKAIDFFKHSKHNKTSIGSVIRSFDISPLVVVFIPFVDSDISEWTFVVNSSNAKLDGNDLQELDIDKNTTISKVADQLLPGITLSKSGNEINAQLSVAKTNVEIYFETTAGYLNKTRALTDATGKATVKVFGDELKGKVKAGFKHFSGKAEVNI